MTVVAALESGAGVWIGWDSQISGTDWKDVHGEKAVVCDGFVVGCAGSAFVCQRFLRGCLGLARPAKVDDPESWVTEHVEPIRASLAEEHEDDTIDVIVAVNGCVVQIDEYGFVYRSSIGYGAIGGGGAVARGALAASKRFTTSPRDAVLVACEAAERHVVGVGGPFQVWSLSDGLTRRVV